MSYIPSLGLSALNCGTLADHSIVSIRIRIISGSKARRLCWQISGETDQTKEPAIRQRFLREDGDAPMDTVAGASWSRLSDSRSSLQLLRLSATLSLGLGITVGKG